MESVMKTVLVKLFLPVLFTATPLIAGAQPASEREDERSCAQVEDLLAAGSSPAEVVTALVDGGMALTGATVFAVECAPEANREALARAGVELASNIQQGQGVVQAVSFAFGEQAPVTLAASSAYTDWVKTFAQPAEYQNDYTPHGGGEYGYPHRPPSSGPTRPPSGGPIRPPSGGPTRPPSGGPVSPAT
jgi:hypothetical protein